LKICFYNVTASFIHGGLETYCWEVGRALARRGHDVTIVAGNRGGPWHDEVRLVQLPFRIEQAWPNFGTRFRRLMERLSFARRGLGHLVTAGYDTVIVNKPFDFPVLWQARRHGMKAQTVFRSGGTDFFRSDRWFADAVDHWVSSSRFNAAEVTSRFHRPVIVIHNGVDVENFRPVARQRGWRSDRAIPDQALLLVSVGRLVGLKGLRVILDAMAGMSDAVHYLVIGEGPQQGALKDRAQGLGLGDRVHFLGRVERTRLPLVLAEADLMVQPSIGVEAFGISVVEAMACGLPVLASDGGGLPEIVLDGQSGRLLKEGDVAVWRAAIEQGAQNREELKRWGEAGRVRAVREFTWTQNAIRLEALLQKHHAAQAHPASAPPLAGEHRNGSSPPPRAGEG
jgi:glycosyltransferase involved in cell wall biosynthesis